MTDAIPHAAGALVPGSRVAAYLIRELIGSGGMAEVFLASDERLDRRVALKVLAPAFAADEVFRERFVRESRAAAAVDDPHILPVFEAGEDSGVLFIAMRYVRGGDLRALLQRGPLAPARAARLISQAASALDAAHGSGLVHRDVKPANLLLDAAGREDRAEHVYLSDFGISKAALAVTGLTGTGQFLGTLDYIAPEQIDGGVPDGRADQYSLACTAFELLAGQPPFHRDSAVPVMFAQLYEQPPALTRLRSGLPGDADPVFARALAKEPDGRYGSCGEFAAALLGALELPGGPAGRRGAPASGHPRTEIASPPAGHAGQAQLTEDWPGSPAPPAPPMPPRPGGRRSGRRPASAATVGASIVLAAAIIAGAIMIGFRTFGGRTGSSQSARSSRSGSATGQHAAGGVPGSVAGVGASQGTGGAAGSPATSGPAGSAPYNLAGALDPGSSGSIASIAWTPDGTLVCVGDQNGSVYLWNAATGRLTGQALTAPGCLKVFAVAISPDGSTLAAGCKSGDAELWNLATRNLISTLTDPGSNEINSIGYSPDGATLATADGNGSTYLWNARNGSLEATLTDPAGPGIAIWSAVFGTGGLLATGDYDGHVYLWNGASGAVEASFMVPGAGSGDPVTALAFSGNGSVLAACDATGGCYLWSVAGGEGSQFGPTPAQPVWSLSFAGNSTLAMADNDGNTYLWRVAASSLSATAAGRLADPATGGQGVGALAFSPNGSWLVTGDTNGKAYRWRAG